MEPRQARRILLGSPRKEPQPTTKVVRLPTMTEEQWQAATDRTTQEWSRVRLPPGWRELTIPDDAPMAGARAAVRGKLRLIFSAGEFDGKWWLHVSITHPLRMPSHMDLAETKRVFIGADRQAIQLFPTEGDHVNLHARALHLWACLDPAGDGLPAFGSHGTI